ncbi:MAG TPA: hypothetical protein VHU91_05295 [Mycobacteriales bacterium]|jgi:hypothetical protein|nr:hypothetical protein [Mycobacteriales bacterium]
MSTPSEGGQKRPPLAVWTVPDYPQGPRERRGLPADEAVPVLGVQLWYPGKEGARPGAWPVGADEGNILVVVCRQLAALPDSNIRTDPGAELVADAPIMLLGDPNIGARSSRVPNVVPMGLRQLPGGGPDLDHIAASIGRTARWGRPAAAGYPGEPPVVRRRPTAVPGQDPKTSVPRTINKPGSAGMSR